MHDRAVDLPSRQGMPDVLGRRRKSGMPCLDRDVSVGFFPGMPAF